MAWQNWIDHLGLSSPISPDVGSILFAVVLIGASLAIGWYAARHAAPRLAAWIHNLGGRPGMVTGTRIAALIFYGVMALLLIVGNNLTAFSPIAALLAALALGGAAGMFVYHAVRLAGPGVATAIMLAGAAFVACAAGTLGGFTPLMAALERVGFPVGAHRISLLSITNAILVVAVLYAVARAANHIVGHMIGRASALDLSQRVLAQKLAGIVVIAAAILLGIDVLGIDLTALTVFSGAAGLAVGFGLQKTLGNLIAGLILLMDRSVKPGDVIAVGDTFGAVTKIGVRAVSVVTRDGKEHLIPNEQLMTQSVENWSYSSPNVRVHIPVRVAFGSDLELAQRLMIEAATAAHRVLTDPAPAVWLLSFAENGVDHDIMVWISDPELGVGNVRSDVLNRLWSLFQQHGIRLPLPAREIHIRSMPDGAGALVPARPDPE